MDRFLKHVLLWTLVVPWIASSFWLYLDGLSKSMETDLAVGIGMLPVAFLGGLYGIFYSSLLTIPLALLSYGVLSQFPRLIQSGISRVAFVAATSAIGFGWAAYTARTLNTARTEYALLAVGLLSGAVLGMASVWLWSSPTPTQAGEKPKEVSSDVPPKV